MPDKPKFLAVIPARGGSKGLPRKNILPAGGKPLLAWTIDAAKQSQYLDRVILSSEDAEIIAVAKQYGCEVPFVRPPELAQDTTPGIDVVLHAIRELPGYDYTVLLQPTSPLRIAADIDGCIAKCLEHHADVCVSVTEPGKSPYWMFSLDEQERLCALFETGADVAVRRQDLPRAYALNGAVYVARTAWLLEHKTFLTPLTLGYIMPPERSLDIDSKLDFLLFKAIVEDRG